MCVSVCVAPLNRFSVAGMTSASSSCARTRTRATRSKSPVTEYTSVTSGIWAMAAPVSGMRATSARISTIAVTTSASLLAGGAPGPQVLARGDDPRHPLLAQDRAPSSPRGFGASSSCLYTPCLGERAHPGRGEPAQQRGEHVRGGQRVGQRPVPGLDARVEVGGERRQLAVGHLLLAKHAVG